MNNAPGYAIAYLRDVDVNNEIVSYIERIDATLAPHVDYLSGHGVGSGCTSTVTSCPRPSDRCCVRGVGAATSPSSTSRTGPTCPPGT